MYEKATNRVLVKLTLSFCFLILLRKALFISTKYSSIELCFFLFERLLSHEGNFARIGETHFKCCSSYPRFWHSEFYYLRLRLYEKMEITHRQPNKGPKCVLVFEDRVPNLISAACFDLSYYCKFME